MLDPRSGAAISIPSAAILFVAAAPLAFRSADFDLRGAVMFAAVGLVFPAVVTILTFRSNELVGPTVTGAVSGTAPLFALLAAGLVLGERIPPQAAGSAAGVLAGVALLSWKKEAALRTPIFDWRLLVPIAGAMVRGFSQVGAREALHFWPSPFAAGLIGYAVSSAVVIAARRHHRPASARLTGKGIAWFSGTGILNGGAVLLMYSALTTAPVWEVAPIVASYPLITAIVSALFLPHERLSLRVVAGAGVTVAAVIYLVGSNLGR
jgi:drug/metabolite transporter (DMT)-like permease